MLIDKGAEQAVVDGDVPITMYQRLKANIDLYKNCTSRPECLTGELHEANQWIWGKAGIGKTLSVTTDHPDYYEKDKSKYWNGYVGQPVVLVDDVEL